MCVSLPPHVRARGLTATPVGVLPRLPPAMSYHRDWRRYSLASPYRKTFDA